MDEKDFEKLFLISEIREEYEEIKSISDENFVIIEQCFVRIKSLEKYLYREIVKSIMLLKVDNASRLLSNLIVGFESEYYAKICNELTNELLNLLKILSLIKHSKRNIDFENLSELKNYYLSMRFLCYYQKYLMNNYSIELNRIINFERGIEVILNVYNESDENNKNVKNKIKKYYEVKNGKRKRN